MREDGLPAASPHRTPRIEWPCVPRTIEVHAFRRSRSLMDSLHPGAGRILSRIALLTLAALTALPSLAASAQAASPAPSAIRAFVYDRTRMDAWQWFAAPPLANSYAYVQTLQRIGIAQQLHRWDWELELSQAAVLDAPSDAVSPVTAQGQLGWAALLCIERNNSFPAAAFLKQGFVRYDGESKNLSVGRFEFFDGQETQPRNATLAWLQANRVSSRLISNFAFTNAERSLDGLDGQWQFGGWNLTAMAARSDQGVFNMNGNPELNVDVQYVALTHPEPRQHILWRVFAIGFHDGRTGITKTDNRPLAVRAADHTNIRVGTYGGNLTAAIPAGSCQFDFLFWGVLQNGRWGAQSQSAGAAALEGGYRIGKQAAAPWLRGGWFRSTGDNTSSDGTHNTFFQLLPTPRLYARLPFYNLMNSTDEFVQVIEKPASRLALRSDLHWLQLTRGHDLWYAGGGA